MEEVLGQLADPEARAAWLAIQALGAVQSDSPTNPVSEVVVTTPSGRPDRLRGTHHVLPEIVKGASRKLLVLGYAMTVQSGLDGLVRGAASRGAFVRLVGDKANAPQFFRQLAREWSPRVRLPEMWLGVPDGELNWLMHCKVVMADDRSVLLGSANFTKNGLHANAELGLHVHDREIAASVELFFNYLKANRLIERFQD